MRFIRKTCGARHGIFSLLLLLFCYSVLYSPIILIINTFGSLESAMKGLYCLLSFKYTFSFI